MKLHIWVVTAVSVLVWPRIGELKSAEATTLPGTRALDWAEADLSGRMMDGAHKFVERKIEEAPAQRIRFWKRDFTSPDAYQESVKPQRAKLLTILGAVENPRPKTVIEHYGDDDNPSLVAETASYRVHQVRWPVVNGVWASGLRVEPKSPAAAFVVVLPDAGQLPEQLLGLTAGIAPANQIVRRLAESGCEVIVPVTLSRDKLPTEDRQLKTSDQTYREWIYRQAFHMGRHPIGYEVQMTMAVVDWLQSKHGESATVGVCGHGEGGMAAFYAAAVDPRIDAALVSGYFDSRQHVWSEPIYRNMWGLLREFGDAELVSLIVPRKLVIEHSPFPAVTGHKGDLRTPEFTTLEAELRRAETGPGSPTPTLISGPNGSTTGPYSEQAITPFLQALAGRPLAADSGVIPSDKRKSFDATARHARLFQELENHVQTLLRQSEHVRNQFLLYQVMPELADNRWSTLRQHPTHDPAKFVQGMKSYRQRFWEEGMGKFDEAMLPFNARTRKVAETPGWTAYDVVLDVFPELFAWGVLVVPTDLKPGERRPVVVCQHGRNGVPRDTVDLNNTAYNNFAAVLAERGFVTFAPHNLYRGEDRYRWLSRKANTVQASLFSFIIAQHDQILKWLETLPFVDGDRIAFYGLSYGGETAVRVPTILEKYCLSICSGDFNQWTTKVAATDQPFGFMRTIEWEMPYWNLGQTFDYAEMAYLMVPRPFMVERGHLDRVSKDHWVAHEYGKVRWLYAQLGLADRTEIEYFQGGHSINGQGTFAFLHRHLKFPAPSEKPR